jgi:DNA/RNA endonuclease G (NUC1)
MPALSFTRRPWRAFSRAVVVALLPVLAACGEHALTPVSAPTSVPRASVGGALPNVVISQVYGGGGNSGATYKNDFIELYNAGPSAVSLAGWSVQYASSTGTSWQTTALSGSIQPGAFYLVQEAAGAGGTTNLPAPDASGNIAMSGTTAKVALVNSTTALTGTGCPITAAVVDFVGYGSANCFEGAATPALSNTTAALRNGGGATDTDNNNADFTIGAPNPRNSGVAPAVVASVVVTPANPTIASGATQQFVAKAFDASSNEIAGVTFTWLSGTPSVATVSTAGLASALSDGSSVISAKAPNGVTGQTTLTVGGAGPTLPETRFSEIHYDNVGTDANERIEIEGPVGTDVTDWQVVLYNGANGSAYNTVALSGLIPSNCGGARGVIVLSYPQNGIENGSPDGFALINKTGQVVEFLSYEGAFAAVNGPASGTTSTDIGVQEITSTPFGRSLQRNASGVWQAPATANFGACNAGGGTPLTNAGITFTGRDAFTDPALPVGFQDQIFATVLDASGTTISSPVTWTALTPSIATIEASTGVMTAVAAGNATFRAQTVDGVVGDYVLPMRVAVPSATALYAGNAAFGEPFDGTPDDDYIVRRPEYTLSYSKVRNTPNWVSYNIDVTHFGAEDRCDCFTFDPALPADFARYTTADYTGAGAVAGYGIDRGHLARSFDRTSASLDNAHTFYFSNIIPQANAVNTGPWATMETFLGDQARNAPNKDVYVIAGVAGSKGTVKNQGVITIPAYVWKVAVILPHDKGLADVVTGQEPEIIAVIMPNDPVINADWTTYKTTVDAIEALSGYDLLDLLPDAIETQLEKGNAFPVVSLTPAAAWTAGVSANLGVLFKDTSVKDAPFTVRINWGDGTPTTQFASTILPAAPIQRPHTYAAPGPYSITVTVTDRGGATTTQTVAITVQP